MFLVTAVLSIAAYAWFFGFQTLMYLQVRYSLRQVPIANEIPIDLDDRSVTAGDGSKLSCFGYEFEAPWQDLDAGNIRRKTMVLIPFRSGLGVLVGHGSTHDLVDAAMNGSNTSPQHFRAAYGDKATGSDYEFLNLALNTTPSQVRLFGSKEDAARKSVLIMMKAIIVPGDSGLFTVRTNEFRGFQYGDPSKHPKRVTVSLYSDKGGIELSFSRKDLKPLAISQADINRVIQTLRYVGQTETAQQ